MIKIDAIPKIVTFIIYCTAGVAHSKQASFRSVAFGETCENVVANEQSLGSTLVEEKTGDFHTFEFEGEYLSKIWTIIFDCGKDNKLTSGTFLKGTPSKAKAKELFTYAEKYISEQEGPSKKVLIENGWYSALWKSKSQGIFLGIVETSWHSSLPSHVSITYRPTH